MYRGLILLPFCIAGLMIEATFFVLLVLPVAVVAFLVEGAVFVDTLTSKSEEYFGEGED